jgi:hypothetical protein
MTLKQKRHKYINHMFQTILAQKNNKMALCTAKEAALASIPRTGAPEKGS